jgi:hypothetical protein
MPFGMTGLGHVEPVGPGAVCDRSAPDNRHSVEMATAAAARHAERRFGRPAPTSQNRSKLNGPECGGR